MIKEELAALLNGREYGNEMTSEEEDMAAAPDMLPIVQKWRDYAKGRAEDAESIDEAEKWNVEENACDEILAKVKAGYVSQLKLSK